MSDVFVSYKAEDRRRIRPLVEALQADGFSVWWDEQIGGGAAWRQAIEAELNAAKCVVVAWSKLSVGSEGTFVQDEATRAQQRHVYVPVTVDKVHLPLGFGETQALPLTGWRGDRNDARYQAVITAVRRNVGARRKAAPLSLARGHVDRRMVIGGGAAAVAIAGVGGWALLRPAIAGASTQSIAVLPFHNLSGDPAQAYFSDGIAEEIRSAFARIGGLKVAGSTSSEAVRNEDAQTAAKKLSVSNILTGSVRQSQSTIRISAELIDGRTGLDKWSQTYDRSPGDAIKIQSDIAENVATALSTTLGQVARSVIGVGATSNAAAQNSYLKAKAQARSDDSENSLRGAIGLLDSAIAIDPKFAAAYALKARTLSDLNGYYTASDGRFGPGFVEAAAVAQQAISLAPNLAAAHLALGYIRRQQLDISAAAAEYQRGHSLDGGNVDDLLSYAGFLCSLGKNDAAIGLARQAQARDPLNPATYSLEARANFNEGRFAEAEAGYQKALSLAPNHLVDRAWHGVALMELGRFADALAELERMPKKNLFRLVGESILYARQGNRGASDAALKQAQQVYGQAANYQFAQVHSQRGEKEQAFAALDQAWKFRDPGLELLKSDQFVKPLRSDPRLGVFLKRMNFPG